MADTQEEIIIIEEGETQSEGSPNEPKPGETSDEAAARKKKRIVIGAAALLLALAGGGGYVLFSSHEAPAASGKTAINEAHATPKEEIIEPSELEKMIDKANTLYANGETAEALKLYQKIALYSEAISQYNLGVIQLKEGKYSQALDNFKRSIASSENRCVSAINAAVCSLHLKREKDFNYYIDLALAYLPQETNSPLYSYYYTLIHYYKGHYPEALSALKHPTSEEYLTTQNKLRAKISALYGNYPDAIQALENPLQEEDSFSLGLLYANTGDLRNAKKYLSDAMMQNPEPIQESLALAFVNLKMGLQEEAAGLIRKTTQAYPDKVYTPYPIRVFLKPSLFEPDAAQSIYRSQKHGAKSKNFQTVFYFAPYKIFNASQAVNYIQKGNASIYVDNMEGAKSYLENSTRLSIIDHGIALAIQKALDFRIRDANAQFNALLKNNPKHSILHYNLGLTYAQMGDFPKAYEHFLRSYHLDADNYLSGIFALMSSDLIGRHNAKLSSILKENLSKEPATEEFELYRTVLEIAQNNFPGASKWLDNRYKERPFYVGLKTLIALENADDDEAKKSSEKLIKMQPADMLPHLLYIDAHFKRQKPKAFASSAINYLKTKNLRYDDLYYGPQITRDHAVTMSVMTGQLAPMIERLKRQLQTTGGNTVDITGALAQAYLFNRQFEESYALYNQLVDTHKIKDGQTLFLGACASIGAEHYENAIALLELSKLTNPAFAETRYALGLLYLQAQNNAAGAGQLSRLGNNGFVSRYFDFAIDTDKLANEPHKYHAL